MVLSVNLLQNAYEIHVERGLLKRAGELLSCRGKVMIVTDDGVPKQYVTLLKKQFEKPLLFVLPQGEKSKNPAEYLRLVRAMLDGGMDRTDAVIALGGGVVGDLAGFAAATYMRGIAFYNIPTTLLSQVDSSVGGKTAVDLDGVKNAIGAFYQPKRVLIDPDVLCTLEQRQIASGMAEIVKMALTLDEGLFKKIEKEEFRDSVEVFIAGALTIKTRIVAADERESGLRRVLNFGHTLGHGIEYAAQGKLLHGECVGLGMLPMSSENVRKRLLAVMGKYGLPVSISLPHDRIMEALVHDKKGTADGIVTVLCDEPGTYRFLKMTPDELAEKLLYFEVK
ncbi:MAG: 3-dehydroquinate synthase [Clostridia bacterium]|nr:3-dehydroquinate synthase [Clostridia bacterium]